MKKNEEWIKAWEENNTPWQLDKVNPYLERFFAKLGVKKGESILVPLCGQSQDLLWLSDKGLEVTGVELSQKAITGFKNLYPQNETKIQLIQGDFFELKAGKFHYCFDRASLIAINPDQRTEYVKIVKKHLLVGGKILLNTLERPIENSEGPPFCVKHSEVLDLYEEFNIELLLEEKTPSLSEKSKKLGVDYVYQRIYLITKV